MWLCSNKSLFIETETVISHVHVLKNSISPFGLSHFKLYKPFLAPGPQLETGSLPLPQLWPNP